MSGSKYVGSFRRKDYAHLKFLSQNERRCKLHYVNCEGTYTDSRVHVYKRTYLERNVCPPPGSCVPGQKDEKLKGIASVSSLNLAIV